MKDYPQESLYIVCNLRKGLARSMDSTSTRSQKSFSFAPTIIDQDDNKTSFEKINESFTSSNSRKNWFTAYTARSSVSEASRRRNYEGNIDHLLIRLHHGRTVQ